MALSERNFVGPETHKFGVKTTDTTVVMRQDSVEALLKQVYEAHTAVKQALQREVLQLTEQLSAKEQGTKSPCGKCSAIRKAFEKYKASHHQIVTQQESKIRDLEYRLLTLTSSAKSQEIQDPADNGSGNSDVNMSCDTSGDVTFLSPSLLGGKCQDLNVHQIPKESSPSLLQSSVAPPAKVVCTTPKGNCKVGAKKCSRGKLLSTQKQRKLWDGSSFVSVKRSGVGKSTFLTGAQPGDTPMQGPESANKQAVQGAAEDENKGAECTTGVEYQHKESDEETAENKAPDFRYCHSPVRKKAARQELPAHDCKECRMFYQGLEHCEALMQKCSRHRAAFAPPATPEYFWEMDFPDSQECRRRGYVEPTQR